MSGPRFTYCHARRYNHLVEHGKSAERAVRIGITGLMAWIEEGKEMSCDNCSLRRLAERKPDSFLARLWRWHTTWCPGWKRHQAELRAPDRERPPTSR